MVRNGSLHTGDSLIPAWAFTYIHTFETGWNLKSRSTNRSTSVRHRIEASCCFPQSVINEVNNQSFCKISLWQKKYYILILTPVPYSIDFSACMVPPCRKCSNPRSWVIQDDERVIIENSAPPSSQRWCDAPEWLHPGNWQTLTGRLIGQQKHNQ